MKLRYRYNWKEEKWELIGCDEDINYEIIVLDDSTVVIWSQPNALEDPPFERIH